MDLSSGTDDEILYTAANGELESNVKENSQTNSKKTWLPIRYIVVLACALSTLAMSFTRLCMGMAMVCMTNHTAILADHVPSEPSETPAYCPADPNVNVSHSIRQFAEDGPFLWNDAVQSLILSAYFWGYIVTQLPAGIVVIKFGAKWTMALSMLISSILCLAIPVTVMHTHVAVLIIVNVGIGLAQGFIYPTIYNVASRWAPKTERTRMLTFSVSGFAIGQMLVNSISANLCSWDPINGWKYIFYIFGLCGAFAMLIWIFIIEDYPSEHRWVSFREANYIKTTSECCQQPGIKIKIPWKAILKSKPFWACLLAEIIFTFKSNALLVDLPTYMKVIMNFDISKNGIINSVPYILKAIIGLIMAFAGDFVVSSGLLSTTSVRKISVTAIAVASCFGLLGVTMAGCHKMMVVTLLTIAIGFDGFFMVATNLNSVDLAPNFVGVLKGLFNVAAAIGNLAAPSIIGLMITNNNSVTTWNNFFYITSGLMAFACFVYLVYGSGIAQPWNEIKNPSKTVINGEENRELDNYAFLKDESSIVN